MPECHKNPTLVEYDNQSEDEEYENDSDAEHYFSGTYDDTDECNNDNDSDEESNAFEDLDGQDEEMTHLIILVVLLMLLHLAMSGGYSQIVDLQINRSSYVQLLHEIEVLHQENKQILQVRVLS